MIPFVATAYGLDYRFFAKPTHGQLPISSAAGPSPSRPRPASRTPAVGEFSQTHSEVTGTFLTGTGGPSFPRGRVRDDDFFLSTFDGAHAYLYRGRIDGKGELAGTYWSGLARAKRSRAQRDDDADARRSRERHADARAMRTVLDFTFPDLDGKPVSLHDPRFAGQGGGRHARRQLVPELPRRGGVPRAVLHAESRARVSKWSS